MWSKIGSGLTFFCPHWGLTTRKSRMTWVKMQMLQSLYGIPRVQSRTHFLVKSTSEAAAAASTTIEAVGQLHASPRRHRELSPHLTFATLVCSSQMSRTLATLQKFQHLKDGLPNQVFVLDRKREHKVPSIVNPLIPSTNCKFRQIFSFLRRLFRNGASSDYLRLESRYIKAQVI